MTFTPNTAVESEPPTLDFHRLGETLVAFFLILTTSSRWSVESAPIAHSHHVSRLGFDNTWALPISKFFEGALADIPYPLFAFLAALLVAVIAGRYATGLSPLSRVLTFAGLTLCLEPRDLLALSSIVLIVLIRQHCIRYATICYLATLGWAVFSTLEFGLVLLLFTIVCIPERQMKLANRKAQLGMIAIPWLVMLLAAAINPGLLRAALRPLTWPVIPHLNTVLPDLRAPWSLTHLSLGYVCLLFVILESVWRNLREQSSWLRKLGLAGLGWLGFSCAWYTALVAASLALCTRKSESAQTQKSTKILITTAGCLLVARVGWMMLSNDITVIWGGYSAGVVDVSRWNRSGAVLLTNLSQTADWDNQNLRKRFPLLLTDRWDGASNQTLQKYARACQDLRVGEGELFLRSDGTYGGYAEVLREYKPSWIVMPSDHLDAIRQFAVSPKWRVVGIDGQRVIFASDSQQMLQAATLWFQLEWPSQSFSGTTEGVLDLGNPEDQRRVSHVFSAMRLPYAALRVLPFDTQLTTKIAQTYARIELAHRAVRQAGQVSLLDHPRAIQSIHELNRSIFLPPKHRERFNTALHSLQTFKVSTHPTTLEEIDVEVHQNVAQGDLFQARNVVEGLPADSVRRMLYVTLLEPLSAEEKQQQLQRLVDSIPGELHSEIQFYLACLDLEIGDGPAAIEHLLKIQPPSEWLALQSLYLKQLGTE